MSSISVTSIHQKLKEALEQKEIEDEKDKAMEMELVLRRIKNRQAIDDKASKNEVSDEIIKDIRSIALDSLGLQTDLFNRSHGSVKKEGTDDIAEAELAAVLGAIEKNALGNETMSWDKYVASRDLVTTIAEEVLPQLGEKVTNKIIKGCRSTIKETDSIFKKSQKVDVRSYQATISATPHKDYEKIYRLFAGATFTVKNYNSMHVDIYKLSLGSTNPIKSLSGSLYQIGYETAKEQIEALNALSRAKNKSHMSHLIFAYELAGWGQGTYDENGNFSLKTNAQYLVYNDPSTPDAIAVRSTKALIYERIFTKQDSDPFGSSWKAISKSYFNLPKSKYILVKNKETEKYETKLRKS